MPRILVRHSSSGSGGGIIIIVIIIIISSSSSSSSSSNEGIISLLNQGVNTEKLWPIGQIQ